MRFSSHVWTARCRDTNASADLEAKGRDASAFFLMSTRPRVGRQVLPLIAICLFTPSFATLDGQKPGMQMRPPHPNVVPAFCFTYLNGQGPGRSCAFLLMSRQPGVGDASARADPRLVPRAIAHPKSVGRTACLMSKRPSVEMHVRQLFLNLVFMPSWRRMCVRRSQIGCLCVPSHV